MKLYFMRFWYPIDLLVNIDMYNFCETAQQPTRQRQRHQSSEQLRFSFDCVCSVFVLLWRCQTSQTLPHLANRAIEAFAQKLIVALPRRRDITEARI